MYLKGESAPALILEKCLSLGIGLQRISRFGISEARVELIAPPVSYNAPAGYTALAPAGLMQRPAVRNTAPAVGYTALAPTYPRLLLVLLGLSH